MTRRAPRTNGPSWEECWWLLLVRDIIILFTSLDTVNVNKMPPWIPSAWWAVHLWTFLILTCLNLRSNSYEVLRIEFLKKKKNLLLYLTSKKKRHSYNPPTLIHTLRLSWVTWKFPQGANFTKIINMGLLLQRFSTTPLPWKATLAPVSQSFLFQRLHFHTHTKKTLANPWLMSPQLLHKNTT